MDFDPLGDPAALSALQQQQEELLRRVAQAAALRKMSMSTENGPMLEGQMVSGHYVPPSIFQHIAAVANPLMQKYDANAMENKVAEQQHILQQAIAAAKQRAIQSFPQGEPGQEATPEQQGNNPSAFVPGQEAVAPRLPSALERLKWMGQASQIPGFAPTAMGMDKIMGEEISREDKQKEAAAALKQTLAAQRQNKLDSLMQQAEDLRIRMEDKSLDRQLREQLARESNSVRLQIGAMTAGATKGLTAAQEATERGRIAEQRRHMTTTVAPVASMARSAQDVQDAIEKYYDPKTKTYKPIPGIGLVTMLGDKLGLAEAASNKLGLGVIPEGSTANAAAVQRFINSSLRSNAGLSQTLTEQLNTMKEMLAGGKYTQEQFVENWQRVLHALNNDLRDRVAGFPDEAVKEYREAGGQVEGVKGTYNDYGYGTKGNPKRRSTDGEPASLGVPQGISQVANDAEYNRLPKGARYMGPDGILRVK